jgi:probable F420-dependent oxidoreductase
VARLRIGVQLSQQDTTIEELRTAWREADELGVDTIWVWDHFFPLYGDPNANHFEAYSLLAAMAVDTSRAQFGALVTCYAYRNPNLLADMARTIDHISGGRFILGIGSGWFAKDYQEYGYEFGTAGSRLRDLARDLPIIKARWERLNPSPLRRIPILIGGGGEKVTLRIVAEHADIWHSFGDAMTMRRKSKVLDDWCARVGRNPAEIQRSTTIARLSGETRAPDEFLDAGFTDFVVSAQGPDWDLAPLRRALAWRDSTNT